MVRDGLVFKDEDGQVIFNQHSFCELVKHLLVELVGISYEEASQIVDRSPLAEPVADAMGVAMFSHDLLHTLRLGGRVVGSVTFQEVDDTPCAEAAADSHNENLQSVNSRSEKFHIHFLHLIKD